MLLLGLVAFVAWTNLEESADTTFVPTGHLTEQQALSNAAGHGDFIAQSKYQGMSLRGRGRARPVAKTTAVQAERVTTIMTPEEAYFSIVEKGEKLARMSTPQVLHSSIMGGCYVGIGGLLALTIAGNMPGLTRGNPGIQRMVFGALFPMNLLLILNTGCQLFTGNAMSVPAAVYEDRATVKQVARSWALSTLGNAIGCGLVALGAAYTGLIVGGTKEFAVQTLNTKCNLPGVGPTVVRAIFCNWLVCLAILFGNCASDMAGRMVGIWFPISTFVAIGFEHSVANLFLLPLGLLAGGSVAPSTIIWKNLVPVFIGNAIAGAVIMALGFSFQFGRLGKKIHGEA